MTMIDLANSEAMIAEAERRQQLRALGLPLHTDLLTTGATLTASMLSVVSTAALRAELKRRKAEAPVRRFKSKWEEAYARDLDYMLRGGVIKSWTYEQNVYVIGIGAKYRPDFNVTMLDGRLEEHEVKGFWRESARVRIKCAAKQYPGIAFRVITKVRGAFVNTETFRGP